jgi:hypothetical protein
MKRLVSIIVLVIVTMSLAGCVVIDEHHHPGPRPHAVIVTPPGYVSIWPGHPHYPHGHYYRGWPACP